MASLKQNAADSFIFLSHMDYGRKLTKPRFEPLSDLSTVMHLKYICSTVLTKFWFWKLLNKIFKDIQELQELLNATKHINKLKAISMQSNFTSMMISKLVLSSASFLVSGDYIRCVVEKSKCEHNVMELPNVRKICNLDSNVNGAIKRRQWYHQMTSKDCSED